MTMAAPFPTRPPPVSDGHATEEVRHDTSNAAFLSFCLYGDRKRSRFAWTGGKRPAPVPGQGDLSGGAIGKDVAGRQKSRFSSAREAERYAADLQLGGYGDWRLPTKAEMFNLARIFSGKEHRLCHEHAG